MNRAAHRRTAPHTYLLLAALALVAHATAGCGEFGCNDGYCPECDYGEAHCESGLAMNCGENMGVPTWHNEQCKSGACAIANGQAVCVDD